MNISITELQTALTDIFIARNTAPETAALVASKLIAAEVDGQFGHGLSRVSSYSAQSASGKVNGHAAPVLEKTAAATARIDVKLGFTYPALAMAQDFLTETTPQTGIAAVSLYNSHHAGVIGHMAEELANAGLIALMFTNSPAAIAPWGGSKGLFGTNPIAFATPQATGEPLVIDLSTAVVARGKIMAAEKAGEPISEGWALNAAGEPTTDAAEAMAGTILPMGGAKGAALVLMIEILSAALTGGQFGFQASSLFSGEGEAPSLGQSIIAIDPKALGGDAFLERLSTLTTAILAQDGTRLPGQKRLKGRAAASDGFIPVKPNIRAELEAMWGRSFETAAA